MRQRWILAVLAAAVVGGLFFWLNRQRASNGREQAARPVAATQGPVEDAVETTGDVSPLNRVEIKPPIQGRLEKLLVDEGASVEKGRILAWMSSSDRAAILDAARAKGPEELARWEDTYKATPIVAPLSGTIILRNVVVGQTVDAGTVLFAMADKLIVVAHVDETDIGRVREGMIARITLDAYPGRPIPGRVFNILFEGKNVSNVITYGVKVEPRSVPAFFRSQMTANVSLVVSSKEDAVLVPAAAVSEDRSGGKRVFVPGPEGEPEARPVKTGLESGENIEIVEGVSAGETVLLLRGRRYSPQRAASSPLVNSPMRRSGQSSESRENGRPGRRRE